MKVARDAAKVRDAEPEEIDGRRRRSVQSREAIAKAMFDLIGEGTLRPSAQRVADRAGVGIRTVFRHFDDMDRLYVEMDARVRDAVRPLLAKETPSGALAGRAQKLVERRCELYERIGPYKRSANLHRQKSDYLRREHRDMVRDFRADLQRWIPELKDASSRSASAMEVAVSFETWDRLRSDQELSQKGAREVMLSLVEALLAQLPRKRDPLR